jgi:sodium transport system ATP-binding protein
MLRTENLAKTFIPPRGEPIEAVRGATFQVGEGEVFGLLGPNGAGKTTLLRMLGTIITPTSGHCWVGDVRSDEAPDAVRHDIGFLSGNTKLYGRLTAAEVLRYFGKLYEMTDADIASRTEELAEMLDMTELLNRRCESLSTGQTQKVSIARVILHAPKVLILDEPTMGLDIITSRAILDFILEAKQRGHCIIFSTHYMTEAELLCDRVGLIHRGDIMGVGTTDELYATTATDNLHDTFLQMVDTREKGAS